MFALILQAKVNELTLLLNSYEAGWMQYVL